MSKPLGWFYTGDCLFSFEEGCYRGAGSLDQGGSCEGWTESEQA